ncbi:O-antigen ligase family protein [Pontibacter liquoris]|uniref:O-antigen ligase family protein n=1 Tax=Pontibacter liquoris TaxID=2905677 RepID=UPI001FA794B3|nr:O-antigen ligase family protein [Pontibacter liquoris]
MVTGIKHFIISASYPLGYKLQLASLILVAATLPFSVNLNNTAIALFIISWVFSGSVLKRLQAAATNKLVWLFISVFAMQVIGLLYTENMSSGLGKIERKAALLLFPILLAGSPILARKHLYAIVIAFIVACLLFCCYTLYILLYKYGTIYGIPNLTETIDGILHMHHAYSGMYLVFATAASLYFSVLPKYFNSSVRVVFGLLALFLFAFLILLAARTAVLTSLILLILALFYTLVIHQKKKVLLPAFLALFVMGLIILSLPNTRHKAEEFYTLQDDIHSPIAPRLIQWTCCFTALDEQKAWLLGLGTGDVQLALQRCYTNVRFWGDKENLNAHNEFLEELVRHGLIGLLLFVASLLFPLLLSLRNRKPLYLLFLVTFIMGSLTETTLSRQKGVVFYSLFNSIFAFGLLRQLEEEEQAVAAE